MNAKDKQLEVSRSMRVTAFKNKKPKFQTLDSFLSVIDASGKTKDISSRCADLDFVMHEELGLLQDIMLIQNLNHLLRSGLVSALKRFRLLCVYL